MRLYPRVSEIQSSVHDYAANLSRESRPLFRVLPSRRRAVSIGDDPDFCRQRFLNSDFARICRSRSVSKSRMASVSLADLERLDRVARMILAGDSQCFWFLSALLANSRKIVISRRTHLYLTSLSLLFLLPWLLRLMPRLVCLSSSQLKGGNPIYLTLLLLFRRASTRSFGGSGD